MGSEIKVNWEIEVGSDLANIWGFAIKAVGKTRVMLGRRPGKVKKKKKKIHR